MMNWNFILTDIWSGWRITIGFLKHLNGVSLIKLQKLLIAQVRIVSIFDFFLFTEIPRTGMMGRLGKL
jgi:hypothetical protein